MSKSYQGICTAIRKYGQKDTYQNLLNEIMELEGMILQVLNVN
jgi:hypothetical protein